MPKLLDKLNQQRPSAEWIIKHSGLPYLGLDLDVPIKDITDEWQSVKHLAVKHRDSDSLLDYKNTGWYSLTLHGLSATITEARPNEEHTWTEIAKHCPKTCQWFKDTFDEKNFRGRIRFMLLQPGGYILPHQDRERSKLQEINIAINNPDGCAFYMENKGIVPFHPGSAFMLDLSNKHWVVNSSKSERLHMIYHGSISDGIVEKSYENLYY